MNVNKVMVCGNVVRDPEVRTTPAGQAVTRISIATNRYYNDKAGERQEQTEYHNVTLWGKQAEVAGKYLGKGQQVFIEGRLQTRKYTGKDGVERYATDIIAESMQLGSKATGGREGESAGSYSAGAQAAKSAPMAKAKAAEVKDDDIPTINLDDDQEVNLSDVPF